MRSIGVACEACACAVKSSSSFSTLSETQRVTEKSCVQEVGFCLLTPSHTEPQVIFKQLEVVEDDALHRALYKKMAPPLVTLLSAEPEIQYVALRNINLVVQKYPTILAHEVKVRRSPLGSKLPAMLASAFQLMLCRAE